MRAEARLHTGSAGIVVNMLGTKGRERIEALRSRMFAQPRYVSIEQARIITDTYRQHQEQPRIMQRALALRAALEQIDIAIDPMERIVGNRTAGVRCGVVFPESGVGWVDREFETLPTRPQDRFQVRTADIEEFRSQIVPFWRGRTLEDAVRAQAGEKIGKISRVVKINQTDHAQGHICPDCASWLAKGPAVLLEEVLALSAKARSGSRDELFYAACAETLRGSISFMMRYSRLAARMAEETGKSETKTDLEEVSDICKACAERAPQTFHEALQALWFLFVVLHMESNASSFSPGRMDQYLLPFYERDIAEGRLTPIDALELVECLWLKFNQIVYMRNASSAKYFAGFPIGFNVALGGVDAEGADASNALSFLFLQAQHDLGLPQPNLSVRLHAGTPDDLLESAVRVVARGSGMPQFFNDTSVIRALRALGVEEMDARNYAIVGCVELTAQGNSLGWSDSAMFNLNKALELALTGGVDLLTGERLCEDMGSLREYSSYEDLERALQRYLEPFISEMIEACETVEQAHAEYLPSPFLSCVVDGCLAAGQDVTEGGAKYNFSGIQMIQVANLADSLAALKQLVFEEKRFTTQEVLAALEANFDGYGVLRTALLRRVPKYGNDIEWVDALGEKWARYFRERLSGFRNWRGGPYHTGMYTVSAHVPMGAVVGASPDGRLAGSPLADGGMSPMYGRDTSGPTAVLHSVSRLGSDLTSNGGLLNMKFMPELFASRSGIDAFMGLLRTFVDLEIPHIQFNVLRKEDLLAAQETPELYRGLTVRVAGYTAYFVELAKELQDEIIARTSYASV